MEICFSCKKKTCCMCITCKVYYCTEHKLIHNEITETLHNFESIGIKLKSAYIAKLAHSLLLKIQQLHAYQNKITEETRLAILNIKDMHKQTMKLIDDKQQKYFKILELSQKPVVTSSMILEFQRQLHSTLICTRPAFKFEKVQYLYKKEFLNESYFREIVQEPKKIKESKPLKTKMMKRMLAQTYGLYLESSNSCVSNLAISDDNKYLISCASSSGSSIGMYFFPASPDTSVRIWDLEQKTQKIVIECGVRQVLCIAISGDSKFFAYALNTIVIRSLLSKRTIATFDYHTNLVRSIVFTKDSAYLISASNDKTVRIYNLLKKIQESVLSGHLSQVITVAVTIDGKYIVSGSSDKTLRIWNVHEIRQEAVLEGHTLPVLCVTISNNSKYIISGSADKSVRVWNLPKKQLEAILLGHFGQVSSVSVSNDGRYIVSTSMTRELRVWNRKEKTEINPSQDQSIQARCALLTNDNQYIVFSSDDGTIRIWNLKEKKQEAVLAGSTSYVRKIVVTSDEKYAVCSVDDFNLEIWNIQEKRKEAVLIGHSGLVYCLALTCDGRFIISGSNDKTVRVWNFMEKKEEIVLKGHDHFVRSLAIACDEKYVVSCSFDKIARVWRFKRGLFL